MLKFIHVSKWDPDVVDIECISNHIHFLLYQPSTAWYLFAWNETLTCMGERRWINNMLEYQQTRLAIQDGKEGKNKYLNK